MPAAPIRVLVLFSHPLMGRGLEQMVAGEPGVVCEAVDVASAGAVEEALARQPSVVVVEEGGSIDAADIVRRSACPVVVDVDITTTRAWTLRREAVSTRPDDFLAAIRRAIGALPVTEPPAPAEPVLRPAAIPG